MSFATISAQMIATIQASSAITTLMASRWPGKSLTVKTGFKTRQEINVADLPIVLIVRPDRKLTDIAAKQYDHSFILFVGIHSENREAAPGLLDDLENAIEDALCANYNQGGTTVDTNFIGSSNDMGMYHPNYFTTMQFEIPARK
jgi:hypothetical protein